MEVCLNHQKQIERMVHGVVATTWLYHESCIQYPLPLDRVFYGWTKQKKYGVIWNRDIHKAIFFESPIFSKRQLRWSKVIFPFPNISLNCALYGMNWRISGQILLALVLCDVHVQLLLPLRKENSKIERYSFFAVWTNNTTMSDHMSCSWIHCLRYQRFFHT